MSEKQALINGRWYDATKVTNTNGVDCYVCVLGLPNGNTLATHTFRHDSESLRNKPVARWFNVYINEFGFPSFGVGRFVTKEEAEPEDREGYLTTIKLEIPV